MAKQLQIAKTVGRPSSFTKELADKICARLMMGESLRKICRAEGMPHRDTVHTWLLKNKPFADQYETARKVQAEELFDEILEIADQEDAETKRSRLRIDARKWYLSKVLPKIYGDKPEGEIQEEKATPGFVVMGPG